MSDYLGRVSSEKYGLNTHAANPLALASRMRLIIASTVAKSTGLSGKAALTSPTTSPSLQKKTTRVAFQRDNLLILVQSVFNEISLELAKGRKPGTGIGHDRLR